MSLLACLEPLVDFLRIEDRVRLVMTGSRIVAVKLKQCHSAYLHTDIKSITNARVLTDHMSEHVLLLSCTGGGNVFDTSLVRSLPCSLTTLKIPRMAHRLTDDDISILPRTLTHLDMANNNLLTNRAVAALPRLLTHLNWASVTRVDEFGHLLPLTSLTSLNLSHIPSLSVGFEAWKSSVPSVTKLNLASSVSFGILPRVLTPNLTMLILSKNSRITDDDMVRFGCCAAMTHLDLANATQLTDAAMYHLPRTLLHLNLGNNKLITNAGVLDMPRSLHYLNLNCNKRISDVGVQYLPPALQHLDLARNNRITNAGLAIMPNTLTYLNLIHNERVSRCFAMSRLPNLKVVRCKISTTIECSTGDECHDRNYSARAYSSPPSRTATDEPHRAVPAAGYVPTPSTVPDFDHLLLSLLHAVEMLGYAFGYRREPAVRATAPSVYDPPVD